MEANDPQAGEEKQICLVSLSESGREIVLNYNDENGQPVQYTHTLTDDELAIIVSAQVFPVWGEPIEIERGWDVAAMDRISRDLERFKIALAELALKVSERFTRPRRGWDLGTEDYAFQHQCVPSPIRRSPEECLPRRFLPPLPFGGEGHLFSNLKTSSSEEPPPACTPERLRQLIAEFNEKYPEPRLCPFDHDFYAARAFDWEMPYGPPRFAGMFADTLGVIEADTDFLQAFKAYGKRDLLDELPESWPAGRSADAGGLPAEPVTPPEHDDC